MRRWRRPCPVVTRGFDSCPCRLSSNIVVPLFQKKYIHFYCILNFRCEDFEGLLLEKCSKYSYSIAFFTRKCLGTDSEHAAFVFWHCLPCLKWMARGELRDIFCRALRFSVGSLWLLFCCLDTKSFTPK